MSKLIKDMQLVYQRAQKLEELNGELVEALKRLQRFVCEESGSVIDEELHNDYLREINYAQEALDKAKAGE